MYCIVKIKLLLFTQYFTRIAKFLETYYNPHNYVIS